MQISAHTSRSKSGIGPDTFPHGQHRERAFTRTFTHSPAATKVLVRGGVQNESTIPHLGSRTSLCEPELAPPGGTPP
jgi:hypothetical protein